MKIENDADFTNRCKSAASCADVVETVKKMESDEYFNCGYGSSLTMDGAVEMEACFMAGDRFGAVGCVKSLKHPSELARKLATDDYWEKRGLLHPMVLVGEGAEKYATGLGIELVDSSFFISKKAENSWRQLDEAFQTFDTVGAVSIDTETMEAEACCSSGGIIFKSAGRLGHSCSYGAAIWAETRRIETDDGPAEIAVAVATTGHGEALIKSNLARGMAEALFTDPNRTFANAAGTLISNRLGYKQHIFGGVALIVTKFEDDVLAELLIFHNCPSLPISWNCSGKLKKTTSICPPEETCQILCKRIM